MTRFHDYFIFFILYVVAFGAGQNDSWVNTIFANVWIKAKRTKHLLGEKVLMTIRMKYTVLTAYCNVSINDILIQAHKVNTIYMCCLFLPTHSSTHPNPPTEALYQYQLQSRRPDATVVTFMPGRSHLSPGDHILPRLYPVPDMAS